MAKYLKLFSAHTDYEAAKSSLILPNVSICSDVPDEVHYNPLRCEERSVYEVVGMPYYPATVDGADTSFDITVNYIRTDISLYCQETVTEGTDTVTVEIGVNPSTSNTRTVTGTVDYYGNEIEYSVTQSKFEAKVTAKFDVTDTSSPTKLLNNTNHFSSIEIDDVVQPSVVSAYTFDTLGEHTVKYTLVDPTIIGSKAFSGCTSLTSIDIPDGVTSIGTEAFRGCSSLSSCTIGDGVISIGNSAFNGCTSLTSIDIPDSVTTIGNNVFYNCSGLTSCTIGSGVTSIGSNAFQDCTSLTNIVIPDSVTSIGNSAFNGCRSLTSCTIGSGVTNIGDSAFRNCRSLTSCTIGDGVTSIGNNAFQNCTSLASCTIGSGVTSIGNNAFQDCTSLSNITCNAMTAPTIDNNTFQNVKTNGTLYVPQGSTSYDVWMGTGNYYLGKYSWTKVEQ